MMGLDSRPWVVPEGMHNKRAAPGGPKTIRKVKTIEDPISAARKRVGGGGGRGREKRGDPGELVVGVEDVKRRTEEEEDWEGKASPTLGPE